MPTRNFARLLLLSTFLTLLVALLASGRISAQEPVIPLSKGNEPISNRPSTSLASAGVAQIDPTLLTKIEPPLLKQILTSPDRTAPFIVYMQAQVNPAAVVATAKSRSVLPNQLTTLDQRRVVIESLQQTARNTQGGVLQALNNSRMRAAPTTQVKPLWIVNAVAAKGSLATIIEMAARPDVKIVRLDKTIKMDDLFSINGSVTQLDNNPPAPLAATTEWGVQKIRADMVHNGLNIDGTGVVVANIDTGVDWLHPALQANYRGYTGAGKLPIHSFNWYDATGGGATYPVDTDGHGTHTMGTLAGSNGLGVAPGAQWIAVRAFDSSGTGLNSWLHDAFQWVLAPNGDPALAPDVVNNSWGNDNGFTTEFQADIEALLNAGIFPVFSAGNNGSGEGTVGSPGSLDIALAVGATDINDEVALFSSRGPSPWGQIKPEVTAPGKDVRSALPGGAYGELSGTSMAAPHVAGLVALMLQADPSLGNNLDSIVTSLKSSAVQLGDTSPNNDYGWGRVDAYNAVMSVTSIGVLEGTVRGSGQPLSQATITVTPRDGGPTIKITTAANGTYSVGLASGTYDVTADAFGYEPTTSFGIDITDAASHTQNFNLTAKPTGTVVGTVKNKLNSAPLAATISVDGTPVSVATNPANGSYSLNLPVGNYNLTVIAPDHRIGQAIDVTINDGATVTQNFLLDRAPAILLVDSGRWYQESQIGYYQQALRDALYAADLWQITDPAGDANDVPTAADLAKYDLVIWSAPADSPGYIGAGPAITEYLEAGGRLLLSGQDVAYYDGGGFLSSSDYLSDYLYTAFVQDASNLETISGVSGQPFDGLSFSITGSGGADNQVSPDVIANTNSDFAGSLLTYDGEQLAGLQVGLCLPYRAIFLSFGIEGINNRAVRGQVMGQAIAWLMESQPAHGLELSPATTTKVSNFGTVMSQTVRLRNIGANPDTYNFLVSNGTPYNWSISNKPTSVPLASCEAQELVLNVAVPMAASWHISDTFTISAQSAGAGLIETVTRTTKTPAPVLLVDDDRWYSFADDYKAALQASNIDYDYWRVPKSWSGATPPSPPLATLQMYPMTLWYTAYDWYQPLLPIEEERLIDYIEGGGHLFFSSQDFLYRHLQEHDGQYAPFAQNYLGIQSHTEDLTSTITVGQNGNPVGNYLGPYDLTFPPGYRNWTDTVKPTASAQVATRGQNGQINSITNAGTGFGNKPWRTYFSAYGPELLSPPEQAKLVQRSLGWLSWLGSSTVTPNTDTSLDGERITYTAIVKNDGWKNINTAYFTATFPAALTPETGSPELTLSNGNFEWSGPLAQNEQKTFTYTAIISDGLPLGTIVTQTNWLGYSDHNILFDQVAGLRVNFPSYNSSSFSASPNKGVEAGDNLNYTLILKNDGLIDSPLVTVTNTLPHMLDWTSFDTPAQGSLIREGRSFTWTLPLAKNETATLTYQTVISYQTSSAIENTVYLDDGFSPPSTLTARTTYKTIPTFFPILHKVD